ALIEPLACVVKAFRLSGIAVPAMGREGVTPLLRKRMGSYLPHWEQEGGIYAITFRLADSLPKEFIDRLRDQKVHDERVAKGGYNSLDAKHLAALAAERVRLAEAELDKGQGSCLLNDPKNAEVVERALKHFDGTRYRLHAYAVMPNHVHVVCEPIPGYGLPDILHSWKSFTSHRINELTGEKGSIWQRESHDRLIRDEPEYEHQIAYALDNPTKGGLKDWKYVGRGSGAVFSVNRCFLWEGGGSG
ncbi:MAG: hypothetical protein EOO39_27140, partial [Cytophagaceae bacterium]